MSSWEAVTILMVEDDDGHARLIERNLRRAGVNNPLLRYSAGAPALSYLFDGADAGCLLPGTPYLMLLDLNLPDMSGVDILARVKADPRTQRIPVVVLTTTDDKVEIQRCYDLGCNAYITKPMNYEDFANAIRQLGLFFTVMQVPESD